MDSIFQKGDVRLMNDSVIVVEINHKEYEITKGTTELMLPPDLKEEDEVKAIVVKGKIKHMEILPKPLPSNRFSTISSARDLRTKQNEEAKYIQNKIRIKSKHKVASNFFKVYSEKYKQKVYMYRVGKPAINYTQYTQNKVISHRK
jgi:hypothetical protein